MFKVQSFNAETLERVTVREGIATRGEARKLVRDLQRIETDPRVAYCVSTR